MKSTLSTVAGLLVGPAIVARALAGAARAAEAATPAGHASAVPADHSVRPGWDHDHGRDHSGHYRDPRWDPSNGNRYDPRWGYYRYDPRWGYYRYDPRIGRYHWDHR
ncbi:hypothetical protein [Actinoallomurus acaciae]|uniref:BA14K family protein n=1 Tax=Actinoallomurus acaciae TaxID=502577 RepID=A0ABV5YP63_9ACTN